MTIMIELLNNFAWLVTLGVVYTFISERNPSKALKTQIYKGLLFAVIVLIVMMNPMNLFPGVVFDGRSIVISIAGLFGGPLPAVLSMLTAGIHRYLQGGSGFNMGLGVIFTSGTIGIIFYYLNVKNKFQLNDKNLYFFGLLVHIVMLLDAALLLPSELVIKVLSHITLPTLTAYPLVSYLLAKILLFQEKRIEFDKLYAENKKRIHFLSKITEKINDSIIVTDLNFRINYINQAAECLYGYSTHELLGKSPSVLNQSPWVEEFQNQLYKTIEKGDTYIGEALNRRKNGDVFYCEMKVSPLKDEENTTIGYIGIQRDVSLKKQLAEQRSRSERMEAVSHLASGMAHDFNNLLMGIRGNIEKLKILVKGPQEEKTIEQTLSIIERTAGVIQKFQMFSKGKTSVIQNLDLYEITTSIFETLKSLNPKIHFNTSLKPSETFVSFDKDELYQVFLNLGTNAIYALEMLPEHKKKEMSILAYTSPREYPNEVLELFKQQSKDLELEKRVLIVVKDNGCGMSPEVKEKAFDPFFSTKTKGTEKGQGLGLSTVYNIIKKHGGHIFIQSEKGQGSSFFLQIPMGKFTTQEAPPQNEVAPLKTSSLKTVLVIDDEEMIRDLATDYLTSLGHKVITAENGTKGLKIYQESFQDIHITFLDMTMPDMSGKDVLQQIHLINKNAKVILCSGDSIDHKSDPILSLATKVLQKPFPLAEMEQLIQME